MEERKKTFRPQNGGAMASTGHEMYEEHGGDEGSELGAISVHNSVIASIARMAALKVHGVVEMSSSFADGLANMVSKASYDRGIKVEAEDQKVNLYLHIVIAYGTRIPQVAWRVQNDVRKAVEDMTGKKVGAVNIIVQGVKALEPEEKTSGAISAGAS